MRFKNNKKKKKILGPITVMLIISAIIMIASLITSSLGIRAEKTVIVNGKLETSLITPNNILSVDGIKYLFSNILLNFKMFEPLVLFIISLIAYGVADASGLLQMLFKPFRKIKPYFITLFVVLIGFISTIIGEYSFVILLPLVGYLYKYINRNSVLGIVTVFLGITLGYASGILFNYDTYLLGTLTQMAATIDVDPNYMYNNLSTIYIMLTSMFIMAPILAKLIDVKIAPKFKKPILEESDSNYSKKGFIFSTVAFIIMVLIVGYLIVPGFLGSGILLDNNQTTYVAKLFTTGAPFKEGIMLIFLAITMVCSFIYGKISRNIETSKGFTESLSKSLYNSGYLFALLFFASQMIAILDWTGLGELVVCKIVEALSMFQFSGILLIVVFFLLVVIMTLVMPSTLGKWTIVSPLIVPLFMRSNITPDLTQFIFQVADGIGKSITPLYAFFVVLLGFMHHNNADEEYDISVFGTIKLMLPTVLIMLVFWVVFIMIWYLSGFPLGISGYSTL